MICIFDRLIVVQSHIFIRNNNCRSYVSIIDFFSIIDNTCRTRNININVANVSIFSFTDNESSISASATTSYQIRIIC